MTDSSRAKEDLHHYLRAASEALLWKLDGLSEYDVRRPMTSTGTNLLGLVKHVGGVTAVYYGLVFDRPFPEPLPWFDEDAEENAHMWATPDESRAEIVGLYRRAFAHADATIAALDLDAVGQVPWWPQPKVTLHRVMAHTIAELHRHTGHADIVRELIDNSVGRAEGNANMPEHDAAWWEAYRAKVEADARTAAGTSGED